MEDFTFTIFFLYIPGKRGQVCVYPGQCLLDSEEGVRDRVKLEL